MRGISYKLFWDPVSEEVKYEYYNYSDKTLKSILKDAYVNGYEQIIFTKRMIEKVLKKSIEEEHVYLKSMNFLESIDENESEDINKIISSINKKPNKYKHYIDRLIDEIQWITDENSIDVKSFELIIKDDVIVIVEIYCNGIIFINDSKNLAKVKDAFLNKVLEDEYL